VSPSESIARIATPTRCSRTSRSRKALTIAPLDQRLTTQEAANFLGISRPTLVKLLGQGEISYERPAAGRHRRVRLNDVLDYQRRKRRAG